MNKNQEESLYKLLDETFNRGGDIHILTVSSNQSQMEPDADDKMVAYKVRVALTYLESDSINPDFDGTDLFVEIDQKGIYFIKEEEWAEGPPIMEGSPVQLALEWVSEINMPFFVSPEALLAQIIYRRFNHGPYSQ